MNENINTIEVPVTAETKNHPGHQVIALTNEIKSFAGERVDLLERVAQ